MQRNDDLPLFKYILFINNITSNNDNDDGNIILIIIMYISLNWTRSNYLTINRNLSILHRTKITCKTLQLTLLPNLINKMLTKFKFHCFDTHFLMFCNGCFAETTTVSTTAGPESTTPAVSSSTTGNYSKSITYSLNKKGISVHFPIHMWWNQSL